MVYDICITNNHVDITPKKGDLKNRVFKWPVFHMDFWMPDMEEMSHDDISPEHVFCIFQLVLPNFTPLIKPQDTIWLWLT